jgi:outer membrane protein assembly factor BamA
VAFDGRLFQSIASGHVLAINVLASADRTPGSSPPPFYLQSWLGGSRTLRGFPNYRFRGESLAHVAVEYRWQAARFLEIAPFVDVGAVSGSGEDITGVPVHTSLGAGLRLRSDDQVFVRLDWATSEGRHRVILSLSPSF